MQHLQLILYILLLSTGFGGVTVSTIFWHRTRERVLLLMVLIISLFSLGLVVFAGLFYLREIVVYPLEIVGMVGYVNAIIVAVMYAAIAVCVRWVRPETPKTALVLTMLPVALDYLAFVFLTPIWVGLADWAGGHGELVTLLSVGTASLYLGFAGWRMRLGGTAVESASVRFLVAWLGRMLLGYSVLAVTSTAVIVGIDLQLNPTVALNFLLFLGWNVVAIVSFIRYLTHPVDLFEAGEVPDEARRRYGLSQRELEVIVQLSRGLSNKEIADKLGVSYTTARTHIYNIFKKTGAASRVELLRILSAR
jgi:DNA-binding CsgD family transcriptional regulator